MSDESFSKSARRQFLQRLKERGEKVEKKRNVELDEVVKKDKEKEGEDKEKRRRLFSLWLQHRGGWTFPAAGASQ